MLLKLFAINDKKMKIYSSFFTSRSPVDALRQLTAAANQGESQLNKFPDDYALMEIAEINDETGEITPKSPSVLAEVSQLIKQKGA